MVLCCVTYNCISSIQFNKIILYNIICYNIVSYNNTVTYDITMYDMIPWYQYMISYYIVVSFDIRLGELKEK